MNEAIYKAERPKEEGGPTTHRVTCGDVTIQWQYRKYATGRIFLRGVFVGGTRLSGKLTNQVAEAKYRAENATAKKLLADLRGTLERRLAGAEYDLRLARRRLAEFKQFEARVEC